MVFISGLNVSLWVCIYNETKTRRRADLKAEADCNLVQEYQFTTQTFTKLMEII